MAKAENKQQKQEQTKPGKVTKPKGPVPDYRPKKDKPAVGELLNAALKKASDRSKPSKPAPTNHLNTQAAVGMALLEAVTRAGAPVQYRKTPKAEPVKKNQTRHSSAKPQGQPPRKPHPKAKPQQSTQQ